MPIFQHLHDVHQTLLHWILTKPDATTVYEALLVGVLENVALATPLDLLTNQARKHPLLARLKMWFMRLQHPGIHARAVQELAKVAGKVAVLEKFLPSTLGALREHRLMLLFALRTDLKELDGKVVWSLEFNPHERLSQVRERIMLVPRVTVYALTWEDLDAATYALSRAGWKMIEDRP